MIVGEEVARDGIIPYLDRYFRSRETRPNLYILVARGRGQEILETNMATFRSSGMTLINLLDLGNTHTVVPIRLVQFVYDLTSASSAAVAPMVQVVEQSSVNIEEMKEGTRPRTLSVKSLAVFNSGGRMVGEMNNAETMGLLWIRDWAELNELTVSYPIVESMESLTLDLVGSTTKTRVEIGEDGIPRFDIEVRTVFDVGEHFGNHMGMDHTWYIDSLEKRANTVIERDIQAAVSKAQALNADVLGFGEEVYRQHPREWERLRNNWPDIFPMVEVTVSSTSEINTRGMSAEKPDNLFEVLK
jgi:spore germination protein KC